MTNRTPLLHLLLVGVSAMVLGQQPPAREPVRPPRDVPARATNLQDQPLFIQASKAAPDRYKFAVDNKAQFLSTPDGRSFCVLWYPDGTSPDNPPPMIVTLHGHASWALDEFFLWQPYAAKRKFGILALQWWFGKGETPNDYYVPQDMYRIIDAVLRRQNIPRQSVLVHGFSRGSANIFGLTALDRASRNHFFLLTVANAGKAGRDFPINQEIDRGAFGQRPFEGTHWVTCAGAHDPHPDRDGVQGMRDARDWVTRHGGTVELSIEDANGDHGCFHRNPANVEAALDVFQRLLKDREEEQKKAVDGGRK